jgi:hypothetical protein
MNEDRRGWGWHGTCQIQTAITDLKKADDRFWEQLLEVFVMQSDDDTAHEALEFAIQIALKDCIYLNGISKMVVAKLSRGDSSGIGVSYWFVPSMEQFIERLLGTLDGPYKHGYMDSDWVQAKRAVNFLVRFRDTSFLPTLQTLFEGMESGKIKPWEHAEQFEAVDNLHFLRTRTRALREIARAEQPDWNGKLGFWIRSQAGLTSNVDVAFSYPKTVTLTPVPKATFTISLKTSDLTEQLKLNRWIMDRGLSVGYRGEGFTGLKGSFFDKNRVDLTPFVISESQYAWTDDLTPTLGRNRLTVYVSSKKEELLSAVAYIHCVKEEPSVQAVA